MYIPDSVALQLAQLERDALWLRALQFPDNPYWGKAANAAEWVVLYLEQGDYNCALQWAKEIYCNWYLATHPD